MGRGSGSTTPRAGGHAIYLSFAGATLLSLALAPRDAGEMQRITGQDIDIRGGHEAPIHIPGHIHEVDRLLAAVHDAGMTVVARDEPCVTQAMLEHRPAWTSKIGRPALLLLALAKGESK